MFKSLSLAIAIASVLTLTPVKKAEAGVIFMATAYATGGATLMAVGGNMAGIAAPVTAAIGMSNHDTVFIYLALGLLFLDKTPEKIVEFKTLPVYLIKEVEEQASLKAKFLTENKEGLKEVVFTQEEVDSLFLLADEETSIEELKFLRDMLTAKALK